MTFIFLASGWGWYPDVDADVRGFVGIVLMLAVTVWAFWPERKRK